MSALTVFFITVSITFVMLFVVLFLMLDPNDQAYDNDEWRDRNG